jgi:hypothetical protein
MRHASRTYISPAILSGTVTLKIGPEGLKYYVHKALLLHYFEYFRKALNGQGTEATEGTIHLEDVAPYIGMRFLTR